jgi:hypothetical protein
MRRSRKRAGGNFGGGNEMDPNLTQPVVLNASINAILIPAPSNPIKDWLPAIISIVVVILGAIATYYVNNQIEMNKRRFELKQKVYFKGLELASEQIVLWGRQHLLIDAAKVQINQLPSDLPSDLIIVFTAIKNKLPVSQGIEFEEQDKKIRQNATLLLIQSTKIDVVGNEATKKYFSDICGSVFDLAKSSSYANYTKSSREFIKKVENFGLAVEDDLINQPKWWQFWKRWRLWLHSPRDRVLWILSENGGKMERSRLRRDTGTIYALLDPVLEELAREGRIKMEDDIITLIK